MKNNIGVRRVSMAKRKLESVQLLDAHYVEVRKDEYNKKSVTPMKTKSMKRNARRTQQRVHRRLNTPQLQTIVQICPVITTSNPFEILHKIKTDMKDQPDANKQPISERLGAPKKSVHERLGSPTQPRKLLVHQRLGSKRQSVFERLGPQPQTKWVKKQENPSDVTSTPRLTVHARLNSENSSKTLPRKVEIAMVDKKLKSLFTILL
jgi:hypothetical protein